MHPPPSPDTAPVLWQGFDGRSNVLPYLQRGVGRRSTGNDASGGARTRADVCIVQIVVEANAAPLVMVDGIHVNADRGVVRLPQRFVDTVSFQELLPYMFVLVVEPGAVVPGPVKVTLTRTGGLPAGGPGDRVEASAELKAVSSSALQVDAVVSPPSWTSRVTKKLRIEKFNRTRDGAPWTPRATSVLADASHAELFKFVEKAYASLLRLPVLTDEVGSNNFEGEYGSEVRRLSEAQEFGLALISSPDIINASVAGGGVQWTEFTTDPDVAPGGTAPLFASRATYYTGYRIVYDDTVYPGGAEVQVNYDLVVSMQGTTLLSGVRAAGAAPSSIGTLEWEQSGARAAFESMDLARQAVLDAFRTPFVPGPPGTNSWEMPQNVNVARARTALWLMHRTGEPVRGLVEGLVAAFAAVSAAGTPLVGGERNSPPTILLRGLKGADVGRGPFRTDIPVGNDVRVRVLSHAVTPVRMQARRATTAERTERTEDVDAQAAMILKAAFERCALAHTSPPASEVGGLRLMQVYEGVVGLPEGSVEMISAAAAAAPRPATVPYHVVPRRQYPNLHQMSGLLPAGAALAVDSFVPAAFDAGRLTILRGSPTNSFLKRLGLPDSNDAIVACAAFAELVCYEAMVMYNASDPFQEKHMQTLETRIRLVDSAVRKVQVRFAAASAMLKRLAESTATARPKSGDLMFSTVAGGLDALLCLRHLPAWTSTATNATSSDWGRSHLVSMSNLAGAMATLAGAGTRLKVNPMEFPFMCTQSLSYLPSKLKSTLVDAGITAAPLRSLQEGIAVRQHRLHVGRPRMTDPVDTSEVMRMTAMQSLARVASLITTETQMTPTPESVPRRKSVGTLMVLCAQPSLMAGPPGATTSFGLPDRAADSLKDQFTLPTMPSGKFNPLLLRGTWGVRCLDRDFVPSVPIDENESDIYRITSSLSKVSLEHAFDSSGSKDVSSRRRFLVPYGAGIAAPPGYAVNPLVSQQRVWMGAGNDALRAALRGPAGSALTATLRLSQVDKRWTGIDPIGGGLRQIPEFVHPHIVTLERNPASTVAFSVVVPVVGMPLRRSREAYVDRVGANMAIGARALFDGVADPAVFPGSDENAEHTRALMFNAERIYQALQLVAAQLPEKATKLPDVTIEWGDLAENTAVANADTTAQLLQRAVFLAFGMLINVANLAVGGVSFDPAFTVQQSANMERLSRELLSLGGSLYVLSLSEASVALSL